MAKQRRSLSGKVVAITGGARGIGKATATALVRKGCRVAIGDLELELAEQTAAGLGGGTIALPLDVTDRGSFAKFLDETERQLGPVDVVVNNAGIMPVTALVDESDASIKRQLDINIYGVIVGTQLAIERMRPRGSGHIVNIASQAGKTAIPGIATYSGTKHAVVGICEAVRAELRGSGVEVHCVMPTVVNTELTAGRRPEADQTGRGRGRRQRDRRRARARPLRRLRAEVERGDDPLRGPAAAPRQRGDRAADEGRQADVRGRPRRPPGLRGSCRRRASRASRSRVTPAPAPAQRDAA